MTRNLDLLRIAALLAFSLNVAQAGPLHDAVKTNDQALLQRLLDAGADINALDDQKLTPLHYAAVRGSAEIVQVLLQRGADVNGREVFIPGEDPEAASDKNTPLHLAAQRLRTDIVGLLYDNGARVPNLGDLVGLLVNAASAGDVATVKKLIEDGVEINRFNPGTEYEDEAQNALISAIHARQPAVIDLLVERGAYVSAEHLRLAICQHDRSLVKQLVEHSGESDPWGSALASAVECGNRDILNDLIAKTGPLDYEDKARYISGRANAELVVILFERDKEFATHFAKLPAEAVANNNAKLLTLLFDKGVSISKEDGSNALQLAAFLGAEEMVELLLEQKVAVDSRSDWGNTPLMRAAPLGYMDVAAALLRRGADVNAKNELFNTALHMACARNLTDMATLLIKNGARVNALNEDRNTPLLQAVRSPAKFDCVKLLVENKANVNAQNGFGMTALHYLAVRNSPYDEDNEFANQLQTNPKAQDVSIHQRPQGDTPKEEDILDAIQLLLSKGADLTLKNAKGETALDLARKHAKNPAIVKLLAGSAGAPAS